MRNAKVTAKITSKEVKLQYPSRLDRNTGRTHMTVSSLSVSFTGLDPSCERAVQLNKGQLARIIHALRVVELAMADSSRYNSNIHLIESLEEIKERQPGLPQEPTVEPQQ